jgi:phytanoyl-CoA hydroxylase
MNQHRPPLSAAQRTQFFEEGYVMAPELFTPADLEPLRQEIAAIIAATAQRLAAEGKITTLHAEEPFETRLTRLMADHPELTGDYIRAIEGRAGGGHAGEAMFGVITHPRLLDAMESLVGPEIVGSSVYRIRPKVPGFARGIVPWHQDSGYFAVHCDRDMIVTCWIPLVEATPENGCLQVLPRVHREGVFTHHTGGHAGYLVIEEEALPLPPDRAVTVPVPLGGALLLTNLTPHCSLPNTTDVIRWSIDLRYQSASVPNNARQDPEAFDSDAPLTEIACYAPEGDFIVRSQRDTGSVHTYEQFAARRARYEAVPIPAPDRDWQPVGTP